MHSQNIGVGNNSQRQQAEWFHLTNVMPTSEGKNQVGDWYPRKN